MMKWSTEMKNIITKIAVKNGFDLNAEEAHLRLTQNGYMPLVIEKIGKHVISIAHYYEQNGDLIADPDVEIFIYQSGDETFWVPIAITHAPPFGYIRAARLNDVRTGIVQYNPKAQRELNQFVNTWARNIKTQGWHIVESNRELQS